ncbi:xanthine dehydrogenase accessory protein XdhC [Deinococcus sp.]|uniref:xanthine dehydrogenase accessory protein XdhC n=1 Tax=Deinococcus sp. TaxID=47478 RepID=UPI0025BC6547|nr:xanthine dehydrogenase accessory protein XdhC [Deinococcus sp.]
MNWLEAVNQLGDLGEPGVLVTLAAVRGHAPREAGAKMVVGRAKCWGSVGGGNLEAEAVACARALLRNASAGPAAPRLLTLRLTPTAPNEHGRQCCGGEVTLLLELLPGARPHVAIFGIGHVGLELALILSRLPLELHLVDSRPAQLTPERLAGLGGGEARLHVRHAPLPETVVAELPAGASLVMLTHDHAEDLVLCDAALRRPELGYVGLIASPAKWSHFREQLRREGHRDHDLSRITTPIGLPDIRGKSPAVIAISVAAQLVQQLEQQAARMSANVPAAPLQGNP